MKKLTVFLLLISLVAAVAGCSPSQPAGDPAQGASASAATTAQATASSDPVTAPPAGQGTGPVTAADAYVLPMTSEPVTFTYLVSDNPSQYKSKTEHLPVTAEIERLTGITLEVEAIPQADYVALLSTRMAAGTDLPDIVNMSLPVGTMYEYGLDGQIANLTPYVEKYDTFLEAVMEAEPDVVPYLRFPDGNYYAWFSVASGTDAADPYGWMIRRDWLEAVGMEAPSTLEEWEAVFEAFRTQDPNGNGDPNDEVPWCAAGLNEQLVWGQAWGLPYRSDGWMLDANGQVQYAWMTEDARELFTWLNMCYTKGYLDPEFLTIDHNSQITRNVAGSFCRFANNLATRTQYAREGGAENAYYMGLSAPVGRDGKGSMDSYGPVTGEEGVVISKDCSDPDLAFRLLDWIWGSEQGTTLLWFGVEGVHWTPNAEGKPNYMGEFFTNNPDGWTSHETAMQSIGGHTFFPSVRGITGYWSYFADAKVEAATEQIAEGIAAMAPSIIPKFPALIATPEESDASSRIWTDITTYFSEAAVLFITGEKPLDEWDAYIADLQTMGIDDIRAIKQTQYDRSK